MGYIDDLITRSKKKAPLVPEKAPAKPALPAPAEPAKPAIAPTPTTAPTLAQTPAAIPAAQAPTPKPEPSATPAPAKQEPTSVVSKDYELPSDKELLTSYAHVKIFQVPDGGKVYTVPVPRPSGPERELLDTIKEAATRLITISPDEIANAKQRKGFFKKRVLEIIESSPELGIPSKKLEFYAETIVREMIGYGPLDLMLEDDRLEEIMVVGPNRPVYVFHRDYGMIKTNVLFGRDDDILAIIDRIARDIGRRIDISSPLLDARLPDGSRVNATIPPISLEGSTITIRKFREDPFSVVDLINFNTLDSGIAAFLWLCVDGMRAKPANIIVSGGTGSGKTTTLNVLASFVPKTERILSMEDTAEIKLPVEHWVRFETRPPGIEGTGEVTMDTLVKNSLRMRPDRIIVGEVRGAEAFTMFTAMNTGHDGSMGTIHANSAAETITRLINPPMSVPMTMLAGLDLIIVEKRVHDRRKGTIRRITEVSELSGVLGGKPQTVVLYKWDAATDILKPTGVPSKFLQELEQFTGASHIQIVEEIRKRKEFLDQLVSRDIHKIGDVCKSIHEWGN